MNMSNLKLGFVSKFNVVNKSQIKYISSMEPQLTDNYQSFYQRMEHNNHSFSSVNHITTFNPMNVSSSKSSINNRQIKSPRHTPYDAAGFPIGMASNLMKVSRSEESLLNIK